MGYALFQRGHINHETVADILFQHPRPSLIDFLNWDELDIRDDAMLGAEFEHLLGLGDAADAGSAEVAAGHDDAEGVDREWVLGHADKGEGPIEFKQRQVGVEVVLGRHAV